MDQIENALVAVGFSHVDAAVYLAVFTNGPISAGRIAKLAQRYRANVYQAIERLKTKGFIGEIEGKKAKLFVAMDPKHILAELRKKQDLFENVLPLLKQMQATSISSTNMRFIEGVNGWRHLLNEFLDSGKERVVYGVPKDAIELMGDFFKNYHKRRAQKKILLRHLFNYDARSRIKITNKLPYTKSKYLPKQLDQPVSTSICGNTVAITAYERKRVFTVVIDNGTIAKAYRKYFEFLWELAKQ
jgi:sugar-specific transcriptional regulator TrmB